jgi:hypothetical protein
MQVSLEEFRRQVSVLFDPGRPAADDRYQLLGTLDPYPEIPPSLLHSGHLASYAVTTGMIEPFDLAALQKPATYLVQLEGLVRYRDSKGRFQRFYLSSDPVVRDTELDVRGELILEKNSIVYVTLQPIFRMPAYIASAPTQTDSTRQRSSLVRMGSADLVQTKGLGLALCSSR